MVTNRAIVLVPLLVGLFASPQHAQGRRIDQPASGPSVTRTSLQLAATADSFAPPPTRAKKRRPPAPRRAPSTTPATSRSSDDESDEEAPRPRPRRRPVPAEAQPDQEDTAEEEEDEEDDSKARRKVSRRRASEGEEEDEDEEGEEEEDDEDEDGPLTSRPVIRPRLITFAVGVGVMGRSFAFNTPLQKESTFPRGGIVAALETYPMMRMGQGWLRRLGIGADLSLEFGSAALSNSATGATASFPVSQRRYSFDVRYAIPAGERVVLVPALGLGNNTFDLKNKMPVAPSACNNMVAADAIALPCIADVQATYFLADLHLRLAATDALALSLSGGYFMGLAVGRGVGQIGQERTPKMSGFHGELGATWMTNDWLALRFALPLIKYNYTFSGGMATYTSASETYYGGTLSAILLTE